MIKGSIIAPIVVTVRNINDKGNYDFFCALTQRLALYITNIVSMILSTGIVPSKLKLAIVLPLIKKQNLDSDSFKNYRLVSNLPFLLKGIEKVVRTHEGK